MNVQKMNVHVTQYKGYKNSPHVTERAKLWVKIRWRTHETFGED